MRRDSNPYWVKLQGQVRASPEWWSATSAANSPATPSWGGPTKAVSNGTTSRRANPCRMPSSRAQRCASSVGYNDRLEFNGLEMLAPFIARTKARADGHNRPLIQYLLSFTRGDL